MSTDDRARRDEQVRFWYLVNTYVTLCGGNPGRNVYGNVDRQKIVARIEEIVFGDQPITPQ